jgi:hypothetical protein
MPKKKPDITNQILTLLLIVIGTKLIIDIIIYYSLP